MTRRAGVWTLMSACLVQSLLPVHGYYFIGCFTDNNGRGRDLPIMPANKAMSLGKCNQLCSDQRFPYFGVQANNECFCGGTFGRHGPRPEGECNRECSADDSQMCGGSWRNSVYVSDFNPGWRYIGCFADGSDRDLPVLAASGSMSIGKCLGECRNRNSAYAGLQASGECWCGNSIGKHGGRPAEECNKACSAEPRSLCGSDWRNSVYSTGLNPLMLPHASDAISAMVREQLAAQVRSQYVAFPDGVMCSECLIASWNKRAAEVNSRVFALKDMDSVLASYPDQVKNKVQALRFGSGARTTFEDYNFSVGGNYAVRKSYLGLAKRSNDNVEFGIVTVELVGHLVPKYNLYAGKRCTRVFGINRCKSGVVREPRGYQAEELQRIEKALVSETYRLFGEKLGQMTV